MPARVQVIVEAKDATSGVLRAITGQLGAFGGLVEELTAQNVSWGNVTERAATMVIEGMKQSIDATVKYAQEVKNLSLISGESLEGTSRFIQVLDDYQVSADDATVATRTLTKNGLAPNLETLARLSDQYKSLNSVQEKNKLVLDNLGRSGMGWVKVLELGGDRIRELGENVDDALIVTEELYRKTEQYRLLQDQMNDTWEGTKIQIGSRLLPALNDLLRATNDNMEAEFRWSDLLRGIPLIGTIMSVNDLADAHKKNEMELRGLIDAQNANRVAMEYEIKTEEELREEEKKQQDALNALTKSNQEYLRGIGDITRDLDNYADKEKDLKTEHAELLREKQTLLSQGWWVESEAVRDVTQKLAENEQAQADNAEAVDLASKSRILSMLQQQLAVDGLSQAETAYLLDLGLKWGVYSQQAVLEGKKAQTQVDLLTRALNNLPAAKTVSINVQMNNAASLVNAGVPSAVANYVSRPKRAAGGRVAAGELYRINENNTEYFRPSANGSVIPLSPGGGGGGVSVSVSYSPMMSLGNEAEIKARLLPLILNGVKEARAQGVI